MLYVCVCCMCVMFAYVCMVKCSGMVYVIYLCDVYDMCVSGVCV